MGPIKPRVEAIKLFGEDHHIPVVRLRDQRDPFYLMEVARNEDDKKVIQFLLTGQLIGNPFIASG